MTRTCKVKARTIPSMRRCGPEQADAVQCRLLVPTAARHCRRCAWAGGRRRAPATSPCQGPRWSNSRAGTAPRFIGERRGNRAGARRIGCGCDSRAPAPSRRRIPARCNGDCRQATRPLTRSRPSATLRRVPCGELRRQEQHRQSSAGSRQRGSPARAPSVALSIVECTTGPASALAAGGRHTAHCATGAGQCPNRHPQEESAQQLRPNRRANGAQARPAVAYFNIRNRLCRASVNVGRSNRSGIRSDASRIRGCCSSLLSRVTSTWSVADIQ